MTSRRHLFTSESVTEGHPDKLADQISDSILDEIIGQDPVARVATETMVTTGMVFVCGEISTDCYVDIPHLVRKTVKRIGYTRAKFGFDGDTCAVLCSIDEQSPDIALGVNHSREAKTGDEKNHYNLLGAGDQGMMMGFACTETPELMPLPISLAHRLARRLAEVRKQEILDYLRPDGKTQITVLYEQGRPVSVETVVVSAQHSNETDLETIREDITRQVILETVPAELITPDTRILINPTGRFVIGGPQGDAGLTGRKLMVDTYGGYVPHGGGAFSGKDPTKVDRSAAYAARYVAKNIVAAGLAKKCQLQVAYAIGVAQPVSLTVDTSGTGLEKDNYIEELIRQRFDLRPAAIIEQLNLRRPIYRQVAAYGHFGRPDLDLPWERTDRISDLKRG